MAYAQWVNITIRPKGFNVLIKNVKLTWGKFHAQGNKDSEVDVSHINDVVVASKTSYTINSCGRAHASSGTEGSFDLYDNSVSPPLYLGTYNWNCPWGDKTNTSEWHRAADLESKTEMDYAVEVTGACLDSGALGNVTMSILGA